MRPHSTVESDGLSGDDTAAMCTYSTLAKLDGHDGDGLAPTGHARPDLTDAELIDKLEEEMDSLPMHT
eukprot:3694336-Karenia_brevis.AAC.1